MEMIGRREKVSFPDLGIDSILSKIDTGAYRTSIHCNDIKVEDGCLHFKPLDKDEYVKYEKFKEIIVKSSFGRSQKRYVIKTLMVIGDKRLKITVSLTNRKNMKCQVLIGRKALSLGDFSVDVKSKFLASVK